MNRADASAFPFLVDQPVAWRVGEIFAERFEGSSDNKFRRPEKVGALARS
jgi:hypothetical protein